jgi:hypothetical protein
MLCGQINKRNQNHRQTSYATALKIDEELDNLRAIFPGDWWNMKSASQLPLEVFQLRQRLKLYYFELKQLTHLPYMLKAITSKKYEYSRTSVLGAVEGMIRCYAERELHPDGLYVMCFLVDFLAFSSGLILAIDLMSQKPLWSQESAEQKWALVEALIADLKRAASSLDHPVANQAAQLLEYLHSARHGEYIGPEFYEATVPYFGKIRIRRPQRGDTSLLYAIPDEDCSGLRNPSSIVEFESNLFDFSPMEFTTTSELDVDWTSIMEDHVTYNWNGIFEF